MALPKRKEEIDELDDLKQRLDELRYMGVKADKLEELRRHISGIVNDLRIRAESIVETVREPLLILDEEMRVVTANPAFYKLFQMKDADVEGQKIYDINHRHWDLPSLRVLLEEMIPQNTEFNDYEISHEFTKIGKRLFLLNARVIHQREERPDLILLAMEDITDRKKAEDEKSRALKELQSALEKVKTLSGLLPVCANCKRVRDDKGNWVRMEKYIEERSEASFSHSICPDCERKLYGDAGNDK